MIYLELALHFGVLSLIAVGGLQSVMPEMQRYVVDEKGWMSAEEFFELFAIGLAAPGPNILVASLVGWKVAGLGGALVALIAICAPAAVLAWWVADVWDRFKGSPWRSVVQRAMAPIVVGLVMASGFVIANPDSPDWRIWAIVCGSAVTAIAYTLNPLWIIFGGGVVGVLLF